MKTIILYKNILLLVLFSTFAQSALSINCSAKSFAFQQLQILRSIECDNIIEILDAVNNASPGDEIIIAPGNYIFPEKIQIPNSNRVARIYASANGSTNRPIIVRAQNPNNPPLLQGENDVYKAYILYITGDNWEFKNLRFKRGSKGIVLDNSNHSKLINLEVFDIGQEALHIRDGSSHTLIDNCFIHDTGKTNPGIGEGIYIGSDKKEWNEGELNYLPECDYTTIINSTIGPNITAENIDIKEGTSNTYVINNVLNAEGISGENNNSADAIIDIKGIYAFIHENTFNTNNEELLNSCIDFQDRKTDYRTGYKNSIYNNTFNVGNQISLPTVRSKGGNSYELHLFENTRIPTSDHNLSAYSLKSVVFNCPDWNDTPCETLTTSSFNLNSTFTLYPNPAYSMLRFKTSLKTYDLKIYNISGQLLKHLSVENNKNPLDISNFATGMYTAILQTNKTRSYHRFIKL